MVSFQLHHELCLVIPRTIFDHTVTAQRDSTESTPDKWEKKSLGMTIDADIYLSILSAITGASRSPARIGTSACQPRSRG